MDIGHFNLDCLPWPPSLHHLPHLLLLLQVHLKKPGMIKTRCRWGKLLLLHLLPPGKKNLGPVEIAKHSFPGLAIFLWQTWNSGPGRKCTFPGGSSIVKFLQSVWKIFIFYCYFDYSRKLDRVSKTFLRNPSLKGGRGLHPKFFSL